jgi:hypothetical protein
VAAAVALLAAPAAAVPTGWTSPSRIFAAQGGPLHSMAVDAGGFIHIATEGAGGSSGIWYLTNDGGPWEKTRITIGDDHSPSLAVDDIGVHIAFSRHDSGETGTWTITNGSGGWIATQRHIGADGAPALDVHSGTEHIAVESADHKLLHLTGAWDSSGVWAAETVDTSCCTSRPSLRLTANGSPRIAYADGPPGHPAGLKLASRGSGWSSQMVDNHRSSSPSLVLDESDHADIVYVRGGAGTWYANKGSSGPWHLMQVSTTASGPPDVSAHSGSVALIYGSNGKLSYSTMSGIIIVKGIFSSSHDSKPEIDRAKGKLVVIYDRSGTSADGIEFTRQK